MLVTCADAFSEQFAKLPASAPATARAAFMVAPSALTLAAESASDNRYMDLADVPDAAAAMAQHAALAEALRQDVPVMVFPGDAACPDGLFPNNVFATAPGRLIIGRMRHAVRQHEADRGDIRRVFTDLLGYAEHDLSMREDLVAELTGSLIIDRARGVGFCGLSERCDLAGAQAMHEAFGLKLTWAFELAPGEYHTNVVMALLASRAVLLAADGFADPAVPAAIAGAYDQHAVMLSPEQKRAFAGNAITLSERRVWISARGAASLTPDQRAQLAGYGFTLGEVPLPDIEKAGGSLRCCVGEIF
ncbi:arginine deiminase-related protein [Oleiagrimonas sp. C23AA]|uniref:arginine deiminase-related protein n=1 Tax=Oleiagrimonas sp. C23AA TaxID=2719047 RepID=UPI001422B55D|nr:arginine deiminase-related protein [Oleiagrimonas sp. C23AA]NII11942.1 amidinotransferase [Oleiagrimonas sp. C23AA]